MKTDDLMTLLAADAAAEADLNRRLRLLAPLCLGALVLIVVLLVLVLGVRGDLGQALGSGTAIKTVAPLLLAGLSLAMAIRHARPVPDAGDWPRMGLRLLGVAMALVWLAALARLAPSAWLAAATGPSIPVCLVTIPLLALFPAAAMVAVLRAGASVRPDQSGLWVGLAAGGMAATVYSLHCPEDSPLFYLLWYGLGIVIAGAMGKWAGARLLRW